MSADIWRFCAVGNIKLQHTDEDGTVFYGTKAFTGGTKVYIEDKTWGSEVCVIGLNRFGHYAFERIPTERIEKVRIQRVFKPTVLKIMDWLQTTDGFAWRGRTAQDRRELLAFVELQNKT